MNVYGVYHASSVNLLTGLSKTLRTDTNFRKDVLRLTQCVLQKAIYTSFMELKAKKIMEAVAGIVSTDVQQTNNGVREQSEQNEQAFEQED